MFNDHKQNILIGIAALFTFALLLPIFIFFFNGVSLAGAIEETVGARYFYTLRNLYGHELPWVPQGYFVGLFHYGIQLLLTLSGHPPSELFPRVDLFVFIATILPHLISGLCFVWAVQPIRDTSSRILVAAMAIAIGYSSTLAYGVGVKNASTEMIWWVTLPDYLAWALPHALVMMGAILRITADGRDKTLSIRAAGWLGVFAGMAVATKITFLVFPFAVASVILYREFKWRTFGLLLGITLPAFVLTGAIIILTYSLWNFAHVKDSFETLIYWIKAERARSRAHHAGQGTSLYSFSYWYKFLWPRNLTDILYFPVIVTGTMVVLGLIKKANRILLALVPACLLAFYLDMHRFYHVTWVEYLFFFYAITVILAVTVFRRGDAAIATSHDPVKYAGKTSFMPAGLFLPLTRIVLSAFLIVLMIPGSVDKFQVLYKFSEGVNAGTAELNSLLNKLGGKTVFMEGGGNNFRIRSIHSAICKGGIDTTYPMWGRSKYMEAMFPEMGCFVSQTPMELTQYRNAVFVVLKGIKDTREAGLMRAEKAFSLSLSAYDCSREVDFPDSIAVICTRSTLSKAPAS